MDRIRRFLFAMMIGTAGSMAGITGCQQDLDIDRAYYECESDADCGEGYACSAHPQYGEVCLPPDSQPQSDGGEADSGTDTTPDAPLQAPLIIDVLSEPDQDLSNIRVYLVESAQTNCDRLMVRPASAGWTSKDVSAREGSSHQVRFRDVDDTASISIVAAGINEDGVRVAVGCQVDVTPPIGGTPSSVEIKLREQLPAFAPLGYRVSMAWQLPSDLDLHGSYARALARLPFNPGVALLGCQGATTDDSCREHEDEWGLLQLTAWARAQSGDQPDLGERRLRLLETPDIRDALRRFFNRSDAQSASDADVDKLRNAANHVVNRVSMEAATTLTHGTLEWNESGVQSTGLTGAMRVERMGLEICSGVALCPRSFVTDGVGSFQVEINDGTVSEDGMDFAKSGLPMMSQFDHGLYITTAFERGVYPTTVDSAAYTTEAGLTSFTDSRWGCVEAANETNLDDRSPEWSDINGLCNDLTTPNFLRMMLADYHDYMKQRFTFEFASASNCDLWQPDYARNDDWKNSPISPMPLFMKIGAPAKCSSTLHITDSEATMNPVGEVSVTFSGEARASN